VDGIAGVAGEIFDEPAEESAARAKLQDTMEKSANVHRYAWRAKNEAARSRILLLAFCFFSFMLFPGFLSSAFKQCY
jgi:hypothetical protein